MSAQIYHYLIRNFISYVFVHNHRLNSMLITSKCKMRVAFNVFPYFIGK